MLGCCRESFLVSFRFFLVFPRFFRFFSFFSFFRFFRFFVFFALFIDLLTDKVQPLSRYYEGDVTAAMVLVPAAIRQSLLFCWLTAPSQSSSGMELGIGVIGVSTNYPQMKNVLGWMEEEQRVPYEVELQQRIAYTLNVSFIFLFFCFFVFFLCFLFFCFSGFFWFFLFFLFFLFFSF